MHNGLSVSPGRARTQLQEDGDLVISQLTMGDSGEYYCVARNKAGERRSSVAILTVRGKNMKESL